MPTLNPHNRVADPTQLWLLQQADTKARRSIYSDKGCPTRLSEYEIQPDEEAPPALAIKTILDPSPDCAARHDGFRV